MDANAIVWLIAIALIVGMVWALVSEDKRKRNRTAQEYERDVAETRETMLRAGMLELDKFVGNTSGKRAAVEYLKDEEQGMTKTGGKGDDAERTKGDSDGKE